MNQDNPILSVEEVVNFINITLGQYGSLRVQGEISDLSGHSRGHYAFFDLKDASGKDCVIQCVVLGQHFHRLKHFIEEGIEVIITGTPSVYAKNGNLKISVVNIEPVKEGAYKKALEQLMKKLEAKGYFSKERKRELPMDARRIGLITSKHGEAVEDFRKNLKDYGFEVFLKGVYVEGQYAEESIINAIKYFNKNKPELDALVLIRGGGSWESLKAFNSELVADEVAASRIPVVAGIGHEKDETIAGLIADQNLSTPSMAASFLSQKIEELVYAKDDFHRNLVERVENKISRYQNRLERFSSQLYFSTEKVISYFEGIKRNFLEKFDQYSEIVNEKIRLLENFENSMIQQVKEKIVFEENRLNLFEAKIAGASPYEIMKKGYSLVSDESGRIIKKASQLKKGQSIGVQFSDGKAEAEIKKINKHISK